MSFMSDMIEISEKIGQAELSNGCSLPKMVSQSDRAIFELTKNIHYPYNGSQQEIAAYFQQCEKINRAYTKERYEQFGITILGDADDLFYNVVLPDRWRVEPNNESSYWSHLFDDNGECIASIFYKAAFYDRNAFIHFNE